MAKNVLRGRSLTVGVNTTAGNYTNIALATSCKISLGSSTVDSTTKDDSEDWEEIDIITRNWSLTSDSLIKATESAAVKGSATNIIDAWLNKTLLYVQFTIGGIAYKGEAYVTQCDADGSVKQNATFSATLTGTGALVKA